ncbi:MAG: hypothetical protein V5B31_07300 [Candidatus Accumulibacter propinquus]|uniref:hypothetical protein n=1 Tax=Candidatus Accumulibacter propinquus TaxID=2954380 RepID=UPI002FC39215
MNIEVKLRSQRLQGGLQAIDIGQAREHQDPETRPRPPRFDILDDASAVFAGQGVNLFQPLGITRGGVVTPQPIGKLIGFSQTQERRVPVQTDLLPPLSWLGGKDVVHSLQPSGKQARNVDLLNAEVAHFEATTTGHGLKLQPGHAPLKIDQLQNRAFERHRNVVLEPLPPGKLGEQ